MFGFVLMLIATLPMLQIAGFSSGKEVVAGIGLFILFAFIYNMGQFLKVCVCLSYRCRISFANWE